MGESADGAPSRGATGDTEQAVSQPADASAGGAAHGADEASGKLPSRERAAELAARHQAHSAESASTHCTLAGTRYADSFREAAFTASDTAAILRAYASGALVPVERAAEAAAWQDISTAPRDCTILVWCPPKHGLPGLTTVALYHPDAGFCVCELRDPTHWRPLPAPPQPEGK
jgi:hypothetical protein